jgi:hypothetical protein
LKLSETSVDQASQILMFLIFQRNNYICYNVIWPFAPDQLPIKLDKEIEDPLEFYSCCGHNMETPRRKIGKTSWASCLKQKQTTWVKGKRCHSLQLNTPSILQLCPIEFHSVPESHYVIFHWAYCSLGNTFHEKDLATIYTMNPHYFT